MKGEILSTSNEILTKNVVNSDKAWGANSTPGVSKNESKSTRSKV